MSFFCGILKEVCIGKGMGEYYRRFLSQEKFERLLLSTDAVKLGSLKKVLEREDLPHFEMIREIGYILEDRPVEARTELNGEELHRGNDVVKEILEDVKNTVIDECGAVRESVAALGDKVTALKGGRGRRHGKYDELGPFCLGIWERAMKSATLRNSLNTRLTKRHVYSLHAAELAEKGVTSAAQFGRIIHAMQVRTYAKNLKKLNAAK